MTLTHRYRFDRFEVHPAERQLLVDGAPAAVGSRAFDVLVCLIERRDRVVTKNELLEVVWPGLVVEENNLSVQVSALRKLLGPQAISTSAGRGYRFTFPLRAEPEAEPKTDPERAPTLARKDRSTIAVLPFTVLSEDSRTGFLADGLAEDVIALLARIPGFLLISRASSFVFRERNASLTEIARQLQVRYVVEGSVRALGEQVRVSTQLTEAETGRVLWTGRFDSPSDQTLDVQDGIARGIISQLEPELTRAEIDMIHRQRPDNLDAWAHYHQAVGAFSLTGWGEESILEALSQLRAAVAVDPAFGLAHAHRALLTALAATVGLIPRTPALEQDVLDAVDRALGLDEGNSEVLGYVGCALTDLGQYERGADLLKQALVLDPSNAQAHVTLGASLALNGQLDAGIDQMRIGMRISPRDRRLGFWGWALGTFLLRAGRVEEALIEARASSQRDPRLYLARVLQAAALDRLGREVEAGAALSVARQLRRALTLDEVTLTHGRRIGERLALLWGSPGPS